MLIATAAANPPPHRFLLPSSHAVEVDFEQQTALEFCSSGPTFAANYQHKCKTATKQKRN